MDILHSGQGHCWRERTWKMLTLVNICLLFGMWIPNLTVNGQVITPNEAGSSPSHVITNKGSPVWLHWAYNYGGDGTHGFVTLKYKEQVIGYKSASQATIQPLAKRIGQNGILTLESSIPAPFNGRVDVIPGNSTLVINNLQYNDSLYQFGSYIILDLDAGGGPAPNKIELKPIVSITVTGIPAFILSPQRMLDVNENSNLEFRVEMDGNPKPSADFKWPHLSGSPPTNPPIVQLYPFIYSSTYSLKNIDASYCGRILQTTVKNRVGSSRAKDTYVTVLLKLNKPFNIKAEKLSKDRCVEVKWNKAESGACYVEYEVKFKNASGNYLYHETGYNIAEINKCNLPTFVNITEIQLTASFRSTSKTFTIRVSESTIVPPTTTIPTTTRKILTKQSSTSSESSKNTQKISPDIQYKVVPDDAWKQTAVAFIVITVILVIIIIITSIIIFKQRRKPNPNKNQKTASSEKQDEMHYMDLQARSNETESNYAQLQAEYEEIEQRNPQYANI